MMKLVGGQIERQSYSEDEIIGELGALGILDVFHVAITEAFGYLSRLRDHEPDINFGRIRTLRCLLNDAVVRRVEAALGNRDDMAFVEEKGTECRVLRIPGLACDIRFKKVDSSGRSSNIPTGRQKRIRNVRGQTEIFGAAARDQITLTLGFEPDDELCIPRRVAIGVEGNWSCSLQAPPADTVGVIAETIRTGLGIKTA